MNKDFKSALCKFLDAASNLSEKDLQPFDGVFHIEGQYEPLVVPPGTTAGEMCEMVAMTQENLERQGSIAEVRRCRRFSPTTPRWTTTT